MKYLALIFVLSLPLWAQAPDMYVDFECTGASNGTAMTPTLLNSSSCTHGGNGTWSNSSSNSSFATAGQLSINPAPVTVSPTTYTGVGTLGYQYTTSSSAITQLLYIFTTTSNTVSAGYLFGTDLQAGDAGTYDTFELACTGSCGGSRFLIPNITNGKLELEDQPYGNSAQQALPTACVIDAFFGTFPEGCYITVQYVAGTSVHDSMNVYDQNMNLVQTYVSGTGTSTAKANYLAMGSGGDAPHINGRHWWQDNVQLNYTSGTFPIGPATPSVTGSSPTWTTTPDSTSVASAISSATAGDTINILGGVANWASTITFNNKSLKIVGPGYSGSTPLLRIGTAGIHSDNCGTGYRITGIHFNLNSSNYLQITDCTGWRVDHDKFTVSPANFMLLAFGNSAGPSTGSFDNNTSTDGQLVEFGEASGTGGQYRWADPLGLGTTNAVIAEDNTVVNTSAGAQLAFTECNMGGRIVTRFNTLTGSRIATHGTQADTQLGCVSSETYNNTLTAGSTPPFRPFFFRGGVNMTFHNTSDGNFSTNVLNIDGPRLNEDSIASQLPNWQFCDGLSQSNNTGGFIFTGPKNPVVDAQGAGGYYCLTQIGRGPMATRWANFSGAPPAQPLVPNYFWKNTQPAGEIPATLSCETGGDALCNNQAANLLFANRDYYAYNASFTGSTGVGEGTLASRPANCTAGTAYWITDRGSWNSKVSPNTSGQLSLCTATNTWNDAYYVPSAYPNPLQGIVSGTSYNPTSKDFGNVQVNIPSTPQTFIVTNTGNGNLLFGTITVGGTNASMFALSNDTCSGQTVTPSNTCSFTITFTPTSGGFKSATVSVPSNAPTSPDSVPVQGTGTQSQGAVSSPSVVMF